MDRREENGIIRLTADGEEIELFIVEQTMLGGINYYLCTDSEEDEAEAYILKEVGNEGDSLTFEFVDDENILRSVGTVFDELLEDVEFR